MIRHSSAGDKMQGDVNLNNPSKITQIDRLALHLRNVIKTSCRLEFQQNITRYEKVECMIWSYNYQQTQASECQIYRL